MRNSLERIHADETTKAVAIASPSIRIGIICSATLCFGTLAWAVFTKIPVHVHGLAVLVSSEGVFQITSPGSGRVIYPIQFSSDSSSVAVTQPSWAPDAYKLLHSPESFSADEVELLAKRVTRSNPERIYPRFSKTSLSGGTGSGGTASIKVRRQQLIAIIDSPALRADISTSLANLEIQKNSSLKLTQLLEQTLRESASYGATKQSQIEKLRLVYREGAVSETDYLREAAELKRIKQNITELRARIADQDRSIAIERRELFRMLSNFLSKCLVFTKEDAEISQLLINQNAEVEQGQVLMTLNWQKEVSPDEIPVFLSQHAISQVGPGMPVLATPLGFSPSDVGGITGQVISLDPYPLSSEEIAKRVGSQGIAQLVSQSGGTFQAEIRLKREGLRGAKQARSAYRDPELNQSMSYRNNRGGYIWNNNTRPPIPPREGFLLATQITTRYQTPMQMLLPMARETLGISPPTRQSPKSINKGDLQ